MYNSKTIACDCGIPIYRQKGDNHLEFIKNQRGKSITLKNTVCAGYMTIECLSCGKVHSLGEEGNFIKIHPELSGLALVDNEIFAI